MIGQAVWGRALQGYSPPPQPWWTGTPCRCLLKEVLEALHWAVHDLSNTTRRWISQFQAHGVDIVFSFQHLFFLFHWWYITVFRNMELFISTESEPCFSGSSIWRLYLPSALQEVQSLCFQSFPVFLIFDSHCGLWRIYTYYLNRRFYPPLRIKSIHNSISVWRVWVVWEVITGFASRF